MEHAPQIPALSVVMPVRNGLPYIEQAVQSVLQQTVHDFELLVIDDGSTDGTSAWLDEIARADHRLIVSHMPPIGMKAAVNHGLQNARADLIARMDADDVCVANRFQRQMDYLRDHPAVVAVGSWAYAIDAEGDPMFPIHCPVEWPEILAKLRSGTNCFIHPSMMYRRQAVLQVGGYQDEYPTDDYGLWLRLSQSGMLGNLSECLLNYRMQASQGSIDKHKSQRQATVKVLSEFYASNNLGMPPEIPVDHAPLSVARIHHHWAMSAVADKQWTSAKKHARLAIQKEPSNLHGWWTLLKSFLHISSVWRSG